MSETPNVFLSWSGLRAKAMADALHGWLPLVIQSVVPFFSDKDIEAGGFWSDAIKKNLVTTNFAIICFTPENARAPWLNYEAGALSTRLEGGTAPWLLDGKPEALEAGPLSLLMAKSADEDGTLHLLTSLNSRLPTPLKPEILSATFQTYWPKLRDKLAAIPAPVVQAPKRSHDDMLEEVVGLCREIARNSQLRDVEESPIWREARNLLESQGAHVSQGTAFFAGHKPSRRQWAPVRDAAVRLVQAQAIAATGVPLSADDLEIALTRIRRKFKAGGQGPLSFEEFVENEFFQQLQEHKIGS